MSGESNDRLDPRESSRLDFERVAAGLVAQASTLSSSTRHEAAGRIGALPAAIRPLRHDWLLCGPVFPVQCPGGDNLWLHRAIYAARPGDVLLVQPAGNDEFGYWGEVMTTAAIARGLAGLVIDGGIRDFRQLCEMPFPVFSRSVTLRGTGKDFGARGWLGAPLLFGTTIVNPGDLLLGDCDGVVVVPRNQVEAGIAASHAREEKEARIMDLLRSGETTLDLFDLNY
jgi:4-hydroxy-4-methyl-2-oxoglutarate aldolase